MIITGKKIDNSISDENGIRILQINEAEIKALNNTESKTKYTYSIKRIADCETLWILISSESDILLQKEGNLILFPIWPLKEYGDRFCRNLKCDCKCIGVSLDVFEEYLIEYINSENLFINVFPTINQHIGSIVNLNRLCNDLREELENYQ